MPNISPIYRSSAKTITLRHIYLPLLCGIFIFLFSNHIHSQSITPTFKREVDSLIKAAPKTFKEIDQVLRKYRQDSTLVRYIDDKSKDQFYLHGQAYTQNILGMIYRDISLYPKALQLFQNALKISLEAESIEFRVFSLNMIGIVYRRTGAIKSALDYNQEALKLAETVAKPSLALKRSINTSLNGIGNIYKLLEQYELAIEKFNQSILLDKELKNTLGLAINHQNLGECYEAQGKLEQALLNFKESLDYNEIINSEKGKIICNYNIGHVYVHQGKVNEAIGIFEKYLQSALNFGDQELVAAIYINYGWGLIQIGDYEIAKLNLEKGLKIAKSLDLYSLLAEGNKFSYELYVKQDDFEQGLKHLILFRNLEKRITNSLNLRYVNDVILRYESQMRANQLEKLAEENESVRLRLRKNRTMLIIIGIFLIFLISILYILYLQSKLDTEKKLLTLEQTMLRNQMNPHFLFNSLNSIKLYIINNEKKNAVHYLNKFSKLIRKILEASSQREISLSEELETVALYMKIENIRFSNEINFNIHIKDNINTHSIKVPSLILQPFLENSLWHGLSYKDGEKKIDLEVKTGKDGFVEIIITDNGVGRDAAKKIIDGKVLKRKSVGIDITKERLANFSRDYENYFHVEIIDKYDEDNNATGTQVIIYIPTI